MPSSKSPKILNVNDSEANLYVISRVLTQAGFEVIEASNGGMARELAATTKPDLILLDVQLPDINGFDLCRQFKAELETKKIPIIHLTAKAIATDDKVRSLREGADAYFTYPVEPPYLVATIRSLLKLRLVEQEREEALSREKEKATSLRVALAELEKERILRDQFMATLTHDLRSPLTSIKMSAQLALRSPQNLELVSRQLARIVRRSEEADALIGDLLDTTLLRAGGNLPTTPELCNLETIGQECIDEMTGDHGARFAFETKGNLQGYWDRRNLRRMIYNLLQNAVKHGSETQPISLTIHENSNGVSVSVINYGDIIPEEELVDIFKPFRRNNDHRKKGWGLGLTLVSGVAKAHEGEVSVSSDAAGGTCFTVRIPKKPRFQEEQKTSTA